MWEVIGYQTLKNQDGEITGYTLHCRKSFKDDGEGYKTRTVWYRPSIRYLPVVGDRILIEEEKRGQYLVVVDIEVM